MSMRRTPPLSIEGSREVLEEMSKPPADTPERRRTFEIAKRWQPIEGRLDAWRYHPGPEDELALANLVAHALTRDDLSHRTGDEKDTTVRSADLSPNHPTSPDD